MAWLSVIFYIGGKLLCRWIMQGVCKAGQMVRERVERERVGLQCSGITDARTGISPISFSKQSLHVFIRWFLASCKLASCVRRNTLCFFFFTLNFLGTVGKFSSWQLDAWSGFVLPVVCGRCGGEMFIDIVTNLQKYWEKNQSVISLTKSASSTPVWNP